LRVTAGNTRGEILSRQGGKVPGHDLREKRFDMDWTQLQKKTLFTSQDEGGGGIGRQRQQEKSPLRTTLFAKKNWEKGQYGKGVLFVFKKTGGGARRDLSKGKKKG